MNVIFGILVTGIINISPIAIVPIIVSGAGAIANGLCYFAFYGGSYIFLLYIEKWQVLSCRDIYGVVMDISS